MEDQVAKFKKLQESAEELKTKKITLDTKYKAKKEALRDVVQEVKDMGIDPNKLGQVIKEKEVELATEIGAFEKEVTEVSAKLAKIEE